MPYNRLGMIRADQAGPGARRNGGTMARQDAKAAADFWKCGRCGTPNPRADYLTHCVGCGALRPSRVAEAGARPTAMLAPRRGRLVAAGSWAAAALALAALAMVHWLGDRWWPATVLLFAPRWLFLLPPAALAVAAAATGQFRLWALQGAAAVVVAGPLMGLSLPLGRLWAAPAKGLTLRIMTFNRGTAPIDADGLIRLVERERIQLICFQEIERPLDPKLEAYFGRGWHLDSRRAIASRLPIVRELDSGTLPSREGTFWGVRLHRVRLRADSGAEFLLADAHMPTMTYGFRALAAGRAAEFDRHVAWRWEQVAWLLARLEESGDVPVLLGGDFNMPSDSPMMRALGRSGRSFRFGFEDAGWGYGYTRPSRLPWVRIDHLLAGPEWAFTRCWVGPDLGSDHLPLIAEATLK
jgi:vancomycin resistance protein VanJ